MIRVLSLSSRPNFHLDALRHRPFSYNHRQRIPVHHLLFQHFEACLRKHKTQGVEGVIGEMITNQLIISVVFQNVFQTRNGQKSQTAFRQIVIKTFQHPDRMGLMLQEIKGQKYIVRPVTAVFRILQNRILIFRKLSPDL